MSKTKKRFAFLFGNKRDREEARFNAAIRKAFDGEAERIRLMESDMGPSGEDGEGEETIDIDPFVEVVEEVLSMIDEVAP